MRRRFALRRVLVVGVLAWLSGCGDSPPVGAPGTTPAPPPASPSRPAESDPAAGDDPARPPCSVVVAAGSPIQDAADAVTPGQVVCVVGNHGGERTTIRRSGRADARIVLRAMGEEPVSTAGFVVEADHVTLDGFEVSTSDRGGRYEDRVGILLAGTGLDVVGNRLSETSGDGIACAAAMPQCRDTRIVGNTVVRADGTGIAIVGSGVTAEGNDVSGSFALNADDADGVRFFGTHHRIARNLIHDIVVVPRPGQRPEDLPHIDCFQTFDLTGLAIDDVTIEENVCTNVEHQCLIATATSASDRVGPVPSSRLVFRNNVCDVRGAQAVYLSGLPGASVTGNLFLDGARYYGVALERAPRAQILNNVFSGSYWPYSADEASVAIVVDGNAAVPTSRDAPPPSWVEPLDRWGVDPGLVRRGPLDRPCFELMPNSPLLDAGVPVSEPPSAGEADLWGRPRVSDGDGDGRPQIDIGPFELTGPAAGAAEGAHAGDVAADRSTALCFGS